MNIDHYLKETNKKNKNLWKKLQINKYAKVDGRTAQSLSRNKTIKHWRKKGYIHFAKDRRKNTSFIIIDPLAKLKKKKNKYFF
jgi:hypothetical protein